MTLRSLSLILVAGYVFGIGQRIAWAQALWARDHVDEVDRWMRTHLPHRVYRGFMQ